jgi:predicted amidohydrolase
MDDQVPTPAQVLRMATAGSAATTPFSGVIGRLEPGMRCDAVLLRWSQVSAPFLDPDTHPIDAVVQRAKTEGVETVLVDGEVIYADRKFLRVDRAAAGKELAERMAAPPSDAERERRTLAKGLIPHVKAFYADYLRDQDRTPYYSPSSRF